MSTRLLNKIDNMSIPEREAFFESLDITQRKNVHAMLQQKVNPEPKCELMEHKANDVDWIESHFWIPELKGPIWIAPYQKRFLNRCLATDENGLYKYDMILHLDSKKTNKSCIAAAVALRRAFQIEWGNIMIVSNSLTQSKSRSFYYIIRALKLNPEMSTMLVNGSIKINRTEILFNFNNTKITAVPLNPTTVAGNNNNLSIFSEVWGYTRDIHEEMMVETSVPPNMHGKAQRYLESYVGHKQKSKVLERLFESVVKEENQIGKKPPLYTDGRTIAMWNHDLICKMPWYTQTYLEQQEKETIPSEFERVFLCHWVSSTNKFVDDILWEQCQGKIPALKPREKLVLAVDVGLADDCFALVGVNKINGKTAVRLSKIWTPTKNRKLHFSNPTANKKRDIEYPFGFIKDLASRYRVLVVRYDPYQAEKLAEDMNKQRISNWKPFSQQGTREKADKYLYDLIRDREIIHDGNKELSAHIKNADAETKGENKLRIVKRVQSSKVDGAVSLSMACYTTKNFRL